MYNDFPEKLGCNEFLITLHMFRSLQLTLIFALKVSYINKIIVIIIIYNNKLYIIIMDSNWMFNNESYNACQQHSKLANFSNFKSFLCCDYNFYWLNNSAKLLIAAAIWFSKSSGFFAARVQQWFVTCCTLQNCCYCCWCKMLWR